MSHYYLVLFFFSLRIFFYHFLGYGFVDFESPAYADNAVKSLQAKGIKAQMAKVGVWVLLRPAIVRFSLFSIFLIFYFLYYYSLL